MLFKILNILCTKKKFFFSFFGTLLSRYTFTSKRENWLQNPSMKQHRPWSCISSFRFRNQKLVAKLILWFIPVQISADTSPHPNMTLAHTHISSNDLRHSVKVFCIEMNDLNAEFWMSSVVSMLNSDILSEMNRLRWYYSNVNRKNIIRKD